MKDILIGLQDLYMGNGIKIYYALEMRKQPDIKQVVEISNKYKDRHFITLLDDNYPDFLKKGYKPPFVVEQIGNKYYYVYGENIESKYELFEDNKPANNNKGVNGDTRQEQLYQQFIERIEHNNEA